MAASRASSGSLASAKPESLQSELLRNKYGSSGSLASEHTSRSGSLPHPPGLAAGGSRQGSPLRPGPAAAPAEEPGSGVDDLFASVGEGRHSRGRRGLGGGGGDTGRLMDAGAERSDGSGVLGAWKGAWRRGG